MQRKLTITVSEEVYDGLYAKVGPRKIGKFLEGLARPHVVDDGGEALARAYAEGAADEEAEREALEWIESNLGETLPPDPVYDAMTDEDWAAWAEAGTKGDSNAPR